jgi:sn-glycerol 3-phosphate transport system substrate-binding protein
VFIGGAGLYIVSKSPPARQDAAWQFIKFLNAPAQQAAWGAATGYIPIRKSAIELPAITQAWAKVPEFRVAYEQILSSPSDHATAGAVIGAFGQVSAEINNAISSLASGTKPNKALAQCASNCNQAIASYNSRI